MSEPSPRRWRRLVLLLLATIAWGLGMLVGRTDLATRVELRLLDLRFQARETLVERRLASPVPVDPTIRIVLIDDRARARHPDTPPQQWAARFGRLASALLAHGARVVGLDFIMLYGPSPEELSAFSGILPYQQEAADTRRGGLVCIDGFTIGDRGNVELSRPGAVLCAAIGEESFGLANLTRDVDRRYRAQMLLPLDLRSRQSGLEEHPFFVSLLAQRYWGTSMEAEAGPWVRAGMRRIPVLSETDRRVLVNFAPAGAFPRISMADVEAWMEKGDDARLKTEFEGRIVLVGLGSRQDQDIVDVPVGGHEAGALSATEARLFERHDERSMLGIEAHAHTLNTLLTQSFLRRLPPWANGLIVLGLCILAAQLTWGARPFVVGGLAAGLLAAHAAAAVALFAWRGVWMEIAPAAPALVFAIGLATADQMVVVRRLFGRYVSRVVADELLSDASQHSLGATGRREVTVLFSDINGFSTICEKRTAEEVIAMLNRYFETMVPIVEAHGGWLKQFVGDEIMAVYGVPRPIPHPERAAVLSALAMARALRLAREADPTGSDGFHAVKIGIHTGEVIVGNVGSAARAERAVVGDDVNLGARVMALAGRMQVVILMTDSTYARVKDLEGVVFTDRGEHDVKGRQGRVRVYEVTEAEVSS